MKIIIILLLLAFSILNGCGGGSGSSGGGEQYPDPLSSVELPHTGQILSYEAGDDGDLQMGIAWPSPRFSENDDETVTDNLTGLIWPADGNTPAVGACAAGWRGWEEAIDYVACVNSENYLGYNDWRLPNINELETLLHAGADNPADWLNTQGFSGVKEDGYWSSTIYDFNAGNAWIAYIHDGGTVYPADKSIVYDVLPVRGGQGGAISVPQTGQAISVQDGDDGDLRRGVSWPATRFTDNGNGTVTDRLTNLVWLKNADCFSGRLWGNALNDANGLASGACGLSDGSAAGDWRLPNRKELRSLVHYGQTNTASWLNSNGFTDVHEEYYWTSTTSGYDDDNAFAVRMDTGSMDDAGKNATNHVLPVRGGPARFNTITLAAIQAMTLNGDDIYCNDDSANEIPAGTIVVYQTNEGRYGKFHVAIYGIDLVINWVTYDLSNDSTVYSQGEGLTIRNTWSAELDEGCETASTSTRDFWWKTIPEPRYIVPGNGATFAVYP